MGHTIDTCLMTDDEYRRFAGEFHSHRAEQMTELYFTGLAFPRVPMSRMARPPNYGWRWITTSVPQIVVNEAAP